MGLRLRGRLLPPGPVLMAKLGPADAPAGSVDLDHTPGHGPGEEQEDLVAQAQRAVAHGARLVDFGPADGAPIAALRTVDPDVIICADLPGADLTRDRAIAKATGAALLLSAARIEAAGPHTEGVVECGHDASTVITAAAPADVAPLARAGWHVLVDVDRENIAATVAVAAVCAWLGATIVRTRHVGSVRQAIDMVEAIRGSRPPFWTRRGLA